MGAGGRSAAGVGCRDTARGAAIGVGSRTGGGTRKKRRGALAPRLVPNAFVLQFVLEVMGQKHSQELDNRASQTACQRVGKKTDGASGDT